MTAFRLPALRPGFLRGFALAGLLLLPFAVAAAFDFLESRRLAEALDQIRDREEPVTLRQTRRGPLPAESILADHNYYQAAALLAAVTPQQRHDGLLDATRLADWSDDLVDRMRQYVERRREALRLLDLAAPMTADGLATDGFRASSTAAALIDLSRLAGFRTTLALRDGDAVRAARALEAELRLARVIEQGIARFSLSGTVERLAATLNRARLPPTAIVPLAASLARLDRDGQLKQGFIQVRAEFIEHAASDPTADDWSMTQVPALWGLTSLERLRRPFRERFVAMRVESLTSIIDALDQPWPVRARVVADHYTFQEGAATSGMRVADEVMSARMAGDLALVRCARVVLAIESYRAVHHGAAPPRLDDLVPAYLPSAPIDPYSGGPVRIHREATGYAVYSVGANGRDEGADFGVFRYSPAGPETRDLGIRIQARR